MSTSAFGIDHGEISKGLPRALKNSPMMTKAVGQDASVKNQYMRNRKVAHLIGREQANNSTGKVMRGTSRRQLKALDTNIKNRRDYPENKRRLP